MTEHLYTMIIVILYFTEKVVFYVVTNLTCPRYILHILHGHPYGSPQHLISNLKTMRDANSFASLGAKSQIFGLR